MLPTYVSVLHMIMCDPHKDRKYLRTFTSLETVNSRSCVNGKNLYQTFLVGAKLYNNFQVDC